jgi:hypothetical protein
MAGAGYKLFNTGDVLTAAQVNTYLQEQAVMRFASAAARTTALSGVLAEGMVSYLMDTNAVEVYDGSAWVGVATGDITAVTAGTGISGGGTSGAVTITNSMATEITAAGDIIVGTGSGTFDNLPIGTTGQVLTADTTVSPYKVKWASASSSSGPAYSAYASANQTPSSSTWTKATFNTEAFDTDSVYDTSTYRFTPNKAGYYQYNFSQLAPSTGQTYVAIYKNGNEVKTAHSPTAAPGILNNSALIYMNGSTDYVECYIYSSTGGTFSASEKWGYIDGVWIRS